MTQDAVRQNHHMGLLNHFTLFLMSEPMRFTTLIQTNHYLGLHPRSPSIKIHTVSRSILSNPKFTLTLKLIL